MLAKLSIELYLYLKDFLHPQEDFLNLLNTSKELFERLKKDYYYYSLSNQSSLRFLKEEEFRTRVINLVKDPCRQIAVKIWDEEFDFALYASSFSVHSVFCSSRTCAIPHLPNVSSYQHSFGEVYDIHHCSHLKTLICSLSQSVSDISNLANIQELCILSGEGLSEETFLSLGKQTKLSLLKCPMLTQVDNLKAIRQLTLAYCPNVQDIRPLRGIRELNIRNCPQIRNISGLGNHYKLSISKCAETLEGYEILYNIPIVHLGNCDISDLSVLQYAKEVKLENCDQVIDVTSLNKVHKVILSYCSNIADISSLQTVRDLSVYSLPALRVTFPEMKANCQFRTCISYDKLQVEQIHLFSAIHHLTVLCSQSHNFLVLLPTSFLHLQSIDLLRIRIDFSLQGFGNISKVRIMNCDQLSSIEGLGNNRYVEIRDCPLIQDVSCLKCVPFVKIIRCVGVKNK